jgi:hypothetical protein
MEHEYDSPSAAGTILAEMPDRCVMIMDEALSGGHLANAIAVIALTVGQRHPGLVGAPLVDASGFSHPGLIPIGIPMLCASQEQLSTLRGLALANQCDVVDFPVEGQQTKNYAEFMDMTAAIATDELHYTGIALIGPRKRINRLVKGLALIH